MNIISRYPWPVLGDGDAVSGTFSPITEIALGKEVINIRGNFNLDNKTIQDLIENDLAHYVLQLTCRATHLRRCFPFTASQFEVVVPATELRGVAQLDYLVVANKDIPDYVNSAAHPDYEGKQSSVSLMPGDILAEGESEKFDARKKYAGTNAVSDLLEIIPDPRLSGSMMVDPNQDKIVASLPSLDFDKLAIFANSRTEKINSILQSSVAFPAIMIALNYAFEEPDSFGRFLWFNALKDRAQKVGLEWEKSNIPNIVQEVLSQPIGRMLKGLKEITDSDE